MGASCRREVRAAHGDPRGGQTAILFLKRRVHPDPLFSQTVEYALRAVVYLASQAPNAVTTHQIAVVTQVPSAYLSKVVQGLCRAGVLQSQRGVGGGVRLCGDPADVTILEVVNAVDPVQRYHGCPLHLESHGTKLCSLHTRLDHVLAAAETAFRTTTLAEVLADAGDGLPLCADACEACDMECPEEKGD